MEHILDKLEQQGRQQLLFTKILCVLCALMLICTLVLTIAITGAVKEITAIAQPLQEISQQASAVMQDLADADLGSMVETVNTLAADSQAAVTAAMKQLDLIDIETLNKAIEDLADVVEPLARVSNFFG